MKSIKPLIALIIAVTFGFASFSATAAPRHHHHPRHLQHHHLSR